MSNGTGATEEEGGLNPGAGAHRHGEVLACGVAVDVRVRLVRVVAAGRGPCLCLASQRRGPQSVSFAVSSRPFGEGSGGGAGPVFVLGVSAPRTAVGFFRGFFCTRIAAYAHSS